MKSLTIILRWKLKITTKSPNSLDYMELYQGDLRKGNTEWSSYIPGHIECDCVVTCPDVCVVENVLLVMCVRISWESTLNCRPAGLSETWVPRYLQINFTNTPQFSSAIEY